MIIKFAHGITKESETWEVISDIERYSFRVCPEAGNMVAPRTDFGDGCSLYFITAGDFTDDGNKNRKWEFFLYKKGKSDAEKIIVQSPVFILNDEGKTIDRI